METRTAAFPSANVITAHAHMTAVTLSQPQTNTLGREDVYQRGGRCRETHGAELLHRSFQDSTAPTESDSIHLIRFFSLVFVQATGFLLTGQSGCGKPFDQFPHRLAWRIKTTFTGLLSDSRLEFLVQLVSTKTVKAVQVLADTSSFQQVSVITQVYLVAFFFGTVQ